MGQRCLSGFTRARRKGKENLSVTHKIGIALSEEIIRNSADGIKLHICRYRRMVPARKGMRRPTIHGIGVCRLACVLERAHTRARRHVETLGREHGAVVEHHLTDGVEAGDGLRRRAGGEGDAVRGGIGDDLDGAAA